MAPVPSRHRPAAAGVSGAGTPRVALVAAAALALCGAPACAADPAPAATAYVLHCLACHGENGGGIDGAGPPLRSSPLVTGAAVEGLVAFLRLGRAASAPESRTGRAMPAFGWLPDGELRELARYVQQRHGG